MTDTFQTFTADTVDAAGRQVVGSDSVLDVCYYDSSSESWTRDYADAPTNPFTNADFSAATITGTGPYDTPGAGWYELGPDATASPLDKGIDLYRLPFDYENEILAEFGTLLTFSTTYEGGPPTGDPHYVTGDYFVSAGNYQTPPKNVFPAQFEASMETGIQWVTSSGVPGGYDAYIAWTLDPPQEIAGFSLCTHDSYGITSSEAVESTVGAYSIQVATSGTGLNDDDYTEIVGATNPYGQLNSIWHDVTPVTAKYVRLVFSNSGSGEHSTLYKFFAYSSEVVSGGMALTARKNREGVGPLEFSINQVVDLSGIDNVYFDIKDHAGYNTYQDTDFLSTITIAGTEKTNFLYNGIYNYSYALRKGCSVNTTGHGVNSTFKLTKTFREHSAGQGNILCLSNFTVVPPWYSEAPSTKRGDAAAFPEDFLVVSDAAGLSIIDVFPDPV